MIGGTRGPRWPTFPLINGSGAQLTMRPNTHGRLWDTLVRPPGTRSINMRSVFKRKQNENRLSDWDLHVRNLGDCQHQEHCMRAGLVEASYWIDKAARK